MNILITDTETTGLKAEECKVIELAFILYNVETATELASASSLIYAPENPAESVNHIGQETLNLVQHSVMPNFIVNAFSLAEAEADFIMAHNAPFDKAFVHAHVAKTKKPWVCSKSDIKWPKAGSGNRLGYLAVDHGIIVNDAHRALGDCRTLRALCQACPNLAEQILETVGSKVYKAIVTFDQKEQAKAAGFNWDGYAKMWKRRMNPAKAVELPFAVEELPNG
jgi:DNA polymerase-3 subunit epsilon